MAAIEEHQNFRGRDCAHKRREFIAKFDQLSQSVFFDMFGDPVANPKGCEPAMLGDLVEEMQYGPRFYNERYSENGTRIVRITDLPYPHTYHIDGLEVQSLTPLTAEMLDRIALHEGVSPGRVGTVIANEEVDDWGSLHEIVEEYHNNVRIGGDGQ